MIIWLILLAQLVLLGITFGFLQTTPGQRVMVWLNRRFIVPLNSLAQRPIHAYGLLAAWTLLLLAGLSLVAWPHPVTHDEFSYRLAGDTFAHGRLVNPMHPLWRFFETFHVITNPIYAAKYPPGQGLFLALGTWIGSPVFGLWLAYTGGILAVYYLLRTALPPGPALLTALVMAAHWSLIRQWGLAFWGGSLPMLGGALALGAAIRLWQNPQRWRAVGWLAVGVFAMLMSRPYEGAIYSLLPLTMLLVRAIRTIRTRQSRVLLSWLPGLALLLLLVSVPPAYNARITGNPLRFPYMYYYERYEQARPFLIQTEGRGPVGYMRPEMREFHEGETGLYHRRRTLTGWLLGVGEKLQLFGIFYIGMLFLLPFLWSLWRPKTPVVRLALGSVGLAVLANLICTAEMTHYIGTATGALAVVVGWGMLSLTRLPGRWRTRGQAFVVAVCLCVLPLTVAEAVIQTKRQSWQFIQYRQQHEAALRAQGGQHVVLVAYGPNHNIYQEWVYNWADIDAQTVIWALDKGSVQNQALFRYYPNRHIWRLRPERNARQLEPVR